MESMARIGNDPLLSQAFRKAHIAGVVRQGRAPLTSVSSMEVVGRGIDEAMAMRLMEMRSRLDRTGELVVRESCRQGRWGDASVLSSFAHGRSLSWPVNIALWRCGRLSGWKDIWSACL